MEEQRMSKVQELYEEQRMGNEPTEQEWEQIVVVTAQREREAVLCDCSDVEKLPFCD
jgi:CDGSH-type Zn-finger protein